MMSIQHSYTGNQNKDPTFLTTLKAIYTAINDDVSPSITDNTYLTLLDNLQLLYVCHVKVVVVLILVTLVLILSLLVILVMLLLR
jgi:hypothetical protein